jgi:hypothetical protein
MVTGGGVFFVESTGVGEDAAVFVESWPCERTKEPIEIRSTVKFLTIAVRFNNELIKLVII